MSVYIWKQISKVGKPMKQKRELPENVLKKGKVLGSRA